MKPLSWRYSAEDAKGDVVSGVLQASGEGEALETLRGRRLKPLALDPSQPSILDRFSRGGEESLSLAELAAATRRLSDLTLAGLPLIKALELARNQASAPKLQGFFSELSGRVRAGDALSIALSTTSARTPVFFRALVQTGEAIGDLPNQLSILADHYERALATRREIIAQLVYPAALITLIFLTLIFLSFFVLPQFETIFSNAGAPPPLETRIALSAGGFIRSYLALAPLAALAGALLWRGAQARYARQIEAALLASPYIGDLKRDHEIGHYCRALSTMLKGGMALSDAMPLAAASVRTMKIREELDFVEAAVRSGRRLSAAIHENASPAKEIVSFLEVGDETGTLGAMAEQAARFCERRVDGNLKRFMALLSPVLTAIMGVLTAGVIAAVMSGVLSLNDAVY